MTTKSYTLDNGEELIEVQADNLYGAIVNYVSLFDRALVERVAKDEDKDMDNVTWTVGVYGGTKEQVLDEEKVMELDSWQATIRPYPSDSDDPDSWHTGPMRWIYPSSD